jgi:hypothetical protein
MERLVSVIRERANLTRYNVNVTISKDSGYIDVRHAGLTSEDTNVSGEVHLELMYYNVALSTVSRGSHNTETLIRQGSVPCAVTTGTEYVFECTTGADETFARTSPTLVCITIKRRGSSNLQVSSEYDVTLVVPVLDDHVIAYLVGCVYKGLPPYV